MNTYPAKLVRVIDGDTMELDIDLGFRIVIREKIRLANIDTPETFRPRNDAEKKHGLAAKQFVELWFASANNIKVSTEKTGKYGRWLGTVKAHLNNPPASLMGTPSILNIALRANGYAKRDNY